MGMITEMGRIRVGTPQNLWGAEHPGMQMCWLAGVDERAFCILYLDQSVDRLSVLTAIFTCDKLGYAEVVLLLPDPNRVLGRALDFEAFSCLRRRLRAELTIITWSPRLALLAAWWRFPVAQTLNHYVASSPGQLPGARASLRWLPALARALVRYVRMCWLSRTPDQAAVAGGKREAKGTDGPCSACLSWAG